jgi:hypothetical protein
MNKKCFSHLSNYIGTYTPTGSSFFYLISNHLLLLLSTANTLRPLYIFLYLVTYIFHLISPLVIIKMSVQHLSKNNRSFSAPAEMNRKQNID